VDAVLEQLKETWEAWDTTRRIQVGAAAALCLVLVIGSSVWASSESWVTVQSGSIELVHTGAGSLSEAGVPHRVRDGVLQVPADQVGPARMSMAIANLPVVPEGGGPMTPREIDLMMRKQLELDLVLAINSLEQVEGSSVRLAMPRKSNFLLEDDADPSASVTVHLKPGTQLDRPHVDGMVALVAYSVEGLSAERVSIVDGRGKQLHSIREGTEPGLATDLQELQAQEEARLVNKIETLLEPTLGAGAYSVTAWVEVQRSDIHETARIVDPEKSGVISEQTTESFRSNGSVDGGGVGTDSNSASAPGAASATDEESSETSTVVNMAPSVRETTTSTPAGEVTGVSVSVTVDEARVLELAQVRAGEGGEVDVDTVRAELSQSISAVPGIDAAAITLTVLPFTEVEIIEATVVGPAGGLVQWMPWAVALLAVCFGFVFVVRPLMTRVMTVEEVTPEGAPVAEDGETEGQETEEESLDLAMRLREMVDNYEAVDADDLNRLVEAEADAAAQVIRLWTRKGA
jgi:flagellar M-ring protein FliF